MSLKLILVSSTAIGLAFHVTFASAADLAAAAEPTGPVPSLMAVDGLNGKFGLFGGTTSDNGAMFGAEGAFSVPLGQSFGLQIDGSVGAYDDDLFAGAAAHLFWRNPQTGLLGLYGSGLWWDRFGGVEAGRLAVEGEAYLGKFTLGGLVGIEGGTSASSGIAGGLIQTYSVKTSFFDIVDLSYYVTDDFMVKVGHRYTGSKHAATAGFEYAVNVGSSSNASFFANARFDEDSNSSVYAGLKVYFGQSAKTLIRKHREDDPEIRLPDDLFAIVNSATTRPSVVADAPSPHDSTFTVNYNGQPFRVYGSPDSSNNCVLGTRYFLTGTRSDGVPFTSGVYCAARVF